MFPASLFPIAGSCAAIALLGGAASPVMADDASLPVIDIYGEKPIDIDKYALPQTREGITAKSIEETINAVDVEDAVKYLPSLFLRKRNQGDTQPVLETRTWSINSSARSLVYVDDVLISALIANNNTIGAPRWGLVSPDEVSRIDMLYGPFAAAYPGNSMGGVMQITTRQPEDFELNGKQTEALQHFSLYGTKKDFLTSQSNASGGFRQGPFTMFLSANYMNSDSQPLAFVTNATPPSGTSGTYSAQNKLGATADVVGAGGLLNSEMQNVKLKLGYDITPSVNLAYTLGYWSNQTQSQVQTYLTDAAGMPSFGNVNGFASNRYTLDEDHLANALSLKTNTRGDWDGEIVATNYTYLNDIQRNPNGVTATGTGFTTAGKIARLDGTGWSTLDLKGIWRPGGIDGATELSAGLHGDQYELSNPTYNTATWQSGSDSGQSLFSSGSGKTRTLAAWAQDAWNFATGWKLTLGGRLEHWRAFDGNNFSGTTSVDQPVETATRFSPKASLNWQFAPDWQMTASVGKAYRFPTVAELYQFVQTGPTFTAPNANLRPEQVWSGELAFERRLVGGKIRLSLFQEQVRDALISQTSFLTGATPVTFVVNVDKIRNRGFELAGTKNDVLVKGLDISGSVTYVDAVTLSDPNFASTTGTTATGKRVPYVPDWRTTVEATYHPNGKLAFTAAVRYAGKRYSTLDNSDVVSHVYGAFDSFLVADIHAHYQVMENLALDVGIDNVNDEKYFLFHPFPGRTFFGALKLTY
jgi:iron complex outermembrane receptor protein